MKKVLLSVVGVIAALAVLAFIFQDNLMDMAKDRLTQDMYVDADTDAFDPGLPVGATFPQIDALHNGKTLKDISEFPIDKGMIFVANRSVSW